MVLSTWCIGKGCTRKFLVTPVAAESWKLERGWCGSPYFAEYIGESNHFRVGIQTDLHAFETFHLSPKAALADNGMLKLQFCQLLCMWGNLVRENCGSVRQATSWLVVTWCSWTDNMLIAGSTNIGTKGMDSLESQWCVPVLLGCLSGLSGLSRRAWRNEPHPVVIPKRWWTNSPTAQGLER